MTFWAASYKFFMIVVLVKGERLTAPVTIYLQEQASAIKTSKGLGEALPPQQKDCGLVSMGCLPPAGMPRKGLTCTSGCHVTTH